MGWRYDMNRRLKLVLCSNEGLLRDAHTSFDLEGMTEVEAFAKLQSPLPIEIVKDASLANWFVESTIVRPRPALLSRDVESRFGVHARFEDQSEDGEWRTIALLEQRQRDVLTQIVEFATDRLFPLDEDAEGEDEVPLQFDLD